MQKKVTFFIRGIGPLVVTDEIDEYMTTKNYVRKVREDIRKIPGEEVLINCVNDVFCVNKSDIILIMASKENEQLEIKELIGGVDEVNRKKKTVKNIDEEIKNIFEEAKPSSSDTTITALKNSVVVENGKNKIKANEDNNVDVTPGEPITIETELEELSSNRATSEETIVDSNSHKPYTHQRKEAASGNSNNPKNRYMVTSLTQEVNDIIRQNNIDPSNRFPEDFVFDDNPTSTKMEVINKLKNPSKKTTNTSTPKVKSKSRKERLAELKKNVSQSPSMVMMEATSDTAEAASAKVKEKKAKKKSRKKKK